MINKKSIEYMSIAPFLEGNTDEEIINSVHEQYAEYLKEIEKMGIAKIPKILEQSNPVNWAYFKLLCAVWVIKAYENESH